MTDAPAFNMNDYQARFLATAQSGADGKEQRAGLAEELFQQYLKEPDVYLGAVLNVCSFISRTDGLPESKESSILVKAFKNELKRWPEITQQGAKSEREKNEQTWKGGMVGLYRVMSQCIDFECQKTVPDYSRMGQVFSSLNPCNQVDYSSIPSECYSIFDLSVRHVASFCRNQLLETSGGMISTPLLRNGLSLQGIAQIFNVGNPQIPYNTSTQGFWKLPVTAAQVALDYAKQDEAARLNFDYRGLGALMESMHYASTRPEHKNVTGQTERAALDEIFEMAERARGYLMQTSPRGQVSREDQTALANWNQMGTIYRVIGGYERSIAEPNPSRMAHIQALQDWCNNGTKNEPQATAYSFAQVLKGMTAALKLPDGSPPQPAPRANGPTPKP